MTGPITRVPRRPPADGAGLTHAGCRRPDNEDAILTDPTGALWAVADGMGGYGHGDLAADLVIEALSHVPHDAAGPAPLVTALEAANRAVRQRAAREGFGQMGATVVAALVLEGRAVVAWVGDSRAYRLSGGELAQLTRDHSVVQDLVDQGRIAPADAEDHPQSHVVTRAIGATEAVAVALAETPLGPGDRLLLCSDGLIRCLGDAEIAALLATAEGPDAACRALVEAALHRGAPDNVSVVVVRAGGADAG
ncbi:MAG: protein phosphatase 2C domain-containing protein [Amaricoccus sp.]